MGATIYSPRTLLGLRITVAGKLALIEVGLSRLPSTSSSPRVDIPRKVKLGSK
jgi:hypothetical protein